jgi:DNA-binding MarR family transcriptional regulator
MSSSQTHPQSLGFLLKRAQHAFRTRVDNALRPLGLTAPQFAVLAAIDRVAGISNAALARLAFVTPQTMQGILVNLERDGLLVRSPDRHHGRILGNALTDGGKQVLEQARHSVDDIERLIGEAVGADEAPAFAAMLSRCAERLGDG